MLIKLVFFSRSVNAEVQPSAEVAQLRARVRALERQLKLQSAAHHRGTLQWRRHKAALQRKLRFRSDRAAAAEQLVQSGLVSEGQLRRLRTRKRQRQKASSSDRNFPVNLPRWMFRVCVCVWMFRVCLCHQLRQQNSLWCIIYCIMLCWGGICCQGTTFVQLFTK